MADNVLVYSDATSISEKSEHDTGRSSRRDTCTDNSDIPTVSIGLRGKNARDLVNGQDKLLTMLQDLKYELSKMDREANRIREDVARSKQTFSVIFNTAEPLHSKPAPELLISTVIPSNRKYNQRDGDLSLQYLTKICTYTPRRPLLSSYRSESQSRNFDDIRDRINCLNQTGSQGSIGYRTPGNRTPQHYMTDDQYSGTESDTESTTSSHYRSHSSMGSYSASTYHGSSESISEEAGSSTESNVTLTSRRSSICGRRTSSFYKQFGDTPQW